MLHLASQVPADASAVYARRPSIAAFSTRCSHCGSIKSPLWRRGEHGEMLCNACGLYWRNHRVKRPLDMINRPKSPHLSSSANNCSPTDLLTSTLSSLRRVVKKGKSAPSLALKLKRLPRQATLQPSQQRLRDCNLPQLIEDSKTAVKPLHMLSRPWTPPPRLNQAGPLASQPLPPTLERARQYALPIRHVDVAGADEDDDAAAMTAHSDGELALQTRLELPLEHAGAALVPQHGEPMQLLTAVPALDFLGTTYRVAERVAVHSKDAAVLFVEIRALFVNEYGQKFFAFYWLRPVSSSDDDYGRQQRPYAALTARDFCRATPHRTVESLDCIIGHVLSN